MHDFSYAGESMYPTLRPMDRYSPIPYKDKRVHCGDVIVFIPPGDSRYIVHRVVSVSPQGVRTRGDNSRDVDPWLLKSDNIVGRLAYVHRDKRSLRIYGGLIGRLCAVPMRIVNLIDSGISFLLRPVYLWLAKTGVFRRWLPFKLKGRIFSFKRDKGIELQLLLGRRVIGRYLTGHNRWWIRRPFRLFIEEASLPKKEKEVRR